ncbi:MAG: glycosyltransferase [Pseudomonadota bacterium]
MRGGFAVADDRCATSKLRYAAAPVKVGFVVPAYQAEKSVSAVVRGLFAEFPSESGAPLVLVVDDGSTDGTSEAARAAGARCGAPRAQPR